MQVAHLRKVARQALVQFGLSQFTLTLVQHAYNTTFKVATPHGVFALRINVNSDRTVEQVRGEVAWVEVLSRDPGVSVPSPHQTLEGEPLVLIESPYFPGPLVVVLYEWALGRHVHRNPPSKIGFLIGQTMVRLHQSASTFEFPDGASRPLMESVLEGLEWQVPETDAFCRPYQLATEALARHSTASPRITHFDIHLGNIKLEKGQLHLFDFDDCVLAWPMIDAAQSMFYLRHSTNGREIERRFWKGYGSVPQDHGMSIADFEALVAGRALLFANHFMAVVTSTLAARAQKAIQRVEFQLKSYLDTGYYDSQLKPPET